MNVKRILTAAALATLACAPAAFAQKSPLEGLPANSKILVKQESISEMEKKFKDIPEEQPTAVYWYWIAGNMSKDGVVKDLQAMKKAGLNRVQIGFIGEGQGAPEGPVKMFTDEWWDIVHTMFKTATELDIEVGLFNCPGWSQSGGPWVKPGQSMRYLGFVKDTVEVPAPVKARGRKASRRLSHWDRGIWTYRFSKEFQY